VEYALQCLNDKQKATALQILNVVAVVDGLCRAYAPGRKRVKKVVSGPCKNCTTAGTAAIAAR
jgi:hypothetical protein